MQRFFLMAVAALASVLVDRRRGFRASARLGDDEERARLRARRHGHRRAPRLDLRRHVLGLRHAGHRSKKKGEFTREELAPLAEVNVTSLKEFDFFTYGQGGRQEGRVRRAAGRLLSGFRQEGRGADAALQLPLKAPVKAKDLSLEIFDREFFVDFSFEDKEPVKLAGAPAAASSWSASRRTWVPTSRSA